MSSRPMFRAVRRIWQRLLLTLVVAIGIGSLQGFLATPAEASHFRYGHYNWHPAGGTTIDFSIQNSFRRDGYSCFSTVPPHPNVPCTSGDGFPGVGDVILEFVGGTTFDPGDGTIIGSPLGALMYVVTSIDPANNWLLGNALDPASLPLIDTNVTHTYTAPGDYVAFTESCCRISGFDAPNAHINNPDGVYRVETIVNVATTGSTAGNSSPVSTMPVFVLCPINALCNFAVPAFDPNADVLSWRLSTGTEAGSGFVQPGPPHAANAASINSMTGLYTWDTNGATLGPAGSNTLYSTQVTIEDRDTAANVKSKVAVDFFIQLVPVVGNPPKFDQPPTPACGTTFTMNVGDTLTFTVQASDPDTGDTVTLNVLGLPPGATMTPPLPQSGNPVSSVFKFTATVGPASFVTTFTATDQTLQQATCTFFINVVIVPPQPPSLEGRMTGGGSIIAADGTKVRHGFGLECDLMEPPHNLQVNWGKGNRFHLELQTMALCTDDSSIDPGQPPAAFDTYEGEGLGRYNGQLGAMAKWKFTDAGEPGKGDFMEIKITDSMGNVVLDASGFLNSGNHQAH